MADDSNLDSSHRFHDNISNVVVSGSDETDRIDGCTDRRIDGASKPSRGSGRSDGIGKADLDDSYITFHSTPTSTKNVRPDTPAYPLNSQNDSEQSLSSSSYSDCSSLSTPPKKCFFSPFVYRCRCDCCIARRYRRRVKRQNKAWTEKLAEVREEKRREYLEDGGHYVDRTEYVRWDCRDNEPKRDNNNNNNDSDDESDNDNNKQEDGGPLELVIATPPSTPGARCCCSGCGSRKAKREREEMIERKKLEDKFRSTCNCMSCLVFRIAKAVNVHEDLQCQYIKAESNAMFAARKTDEERYGVQE